MAKYVCPRCGGGMPKLKKEKCLWCNLEVGSYDPAKAKAFGL